MKPGLFGVVVLLLFFFWGGGGGLNFIMDHGLFPSEYDVINVFKVVLVCIQNVFSLYFFI